MIVETGADYRVFVMRQACRRSWRIGQTQPIKVVIMAYRNTLRADALTLVARKLQSSLAVQGELPEDGLAAYGDHGDDLMLALARKLVSGDEEDESDSVESAFAQAQQVAADAESLLVDASWRPVEAVPEPPLIIDAEVIETSPAVAMPCEHHTGEAPEQHDLFSWARVPLGRAEADQVPQSEAGPADRLAFRVGARTRVAGRPRQRRRVMAVSFRAREALGLLD